MRLFVGTFPVRSMRLPTLLRCGKCLFFSSGARESSPPPLMLACLLRMIWLTESIVDWLFLEKNIVGWLVDLADNLK
jgi:hypothetical protein